MNTTTKADGFINETVRPLLRPGETFVSSAYLYPKLEARTGVGSFVQAATAKAAFAVLTEQRLILVETGLGVLEPLLENHRTRSLEKSDIAGVFTGKTLMIELTDGAMAQYANNRGSKFVSTQRAFFEGLEQALGRSEKAAALAKADARSTLITRALIAVAVVGYAAYRLITNA